MKHEWLMSDILSSVLLTFANRNNNVLCSGDEFKGCL